MEKEKAEEQKNSFTFSVNGKPVQARPGDTVHAALIRAGYDRLRKSRTGSPRGVFCGMGTCFECLVTINDTSMKQSCMTPAEAGMRVEIDDG